jgi:hypothetical protein
MPPMQSALRRSLIGKTLLLTGSTGEVLVTSDWNHFEGSLTALSRLVVDLTHFRD